MDHTQAVRLQAAEKYLLGELDPALRDEYEEHYFDCRECALDIRVAAVFAATSRQVFREDAVAAERAERAGRRATARPSFIERFRWTFAAVPAFAALVLAAIVTYQDTVTIPQLRNRVNQPVAGYGQTIELGASGTRGGSETSANTSTFAIRPDSPLTVAFDFTPNSLAPGYVCQLQNPSGKVLLQVAASAEQANQRYVLSVPGGLLRTAGIYRIVFLTAESSTGQPVQGSEVQQLLLPVAFHL